MKPEPIGTYGPFILIEQIAQSDALKVYRAESDKRIREEIFAAKRDPECIDAEVKLYILSCKDGRLDLDPDEFLKKTANALKQDHPLINRVVATGRIEETVYAATRYIDGPALSHIIPSLQGSGLPPPLAAWIIAEASEALAILQEFVGKKESPSKDAMYIAPSDVYLDQCGGIILDRLDMTAALSVAWKGSRSLLKDKFGYMSPEQIDGRPATHKSDLFICGIMLHELLTGRPLFAHKSKSRTIMSIKETRVSPPSEVSPWIEEKLDNIVLSALAKSPDDRPSNIRKWAESLKEYVKNRHPGFGPESAIKLLVRKPEDAGQSAGERKETRAAGLTREKFGPEFKQNTVLAEAFDDASSQPTRTAVAAPGRENLSKSPCANATRKVKRTQRLFPNKNRYDIGIALVAGLLTIAGATLLFFSGSRAKTGAESADSKQTALPSGPATALDPDNPSGNTNDLAVGLVRYGTFSGKNPEKYTLEIHLEAENTSDKSLEFNPGEIVLKLTDHDPRAPLFWSSDKKGSLVLNPSENRRFVLGFHLSSPPGDNSWRIVIY